MKTNLRFNIRDFKTSSIAKKDVNDLPQKIKDNISKSLLYSCLYWASHLSETSREAVEVLVSGFFQCLKAVYWIEVPSVVGELKARLSALQSVMGFFKACSRQCVYCESHYSLLS